MNPKVINHHDGYIIVMDGYITVMEGCVVAMPELVMTHI